MSNEDHPGIDVFYQTLKEIRKRANVQDVLVEIYDVGEDYWPFSKRIYILAKSNEEEISKWVENLKPSEVEIIKPSNRTKNVPQLKDGYQIISIWWD